MKKFIIGLMVAVVLGSVPFVAKAALLDEIRNWFAPTVESSVSVTLDPSSPLPRIVVISRNQATSDVVLARYAIRSPRNGILTTLQMRLNTSGIAANRLFRPAITGDSTINVALQINGRTYRPDVSGWGTPTPILTFSNMNEVLSANTNVVATLVGTVPPDTDGTLSPSSASTSLTAGVANPRIEDVNRAVLAVTANTSVSSGVTFDSSGVVVSNMSAAAGNPLVANNVVVSQGVSYTFTITAGDNTLYLSRNPRVAFATSSTGFTPPNQTVLHETVASPANVAGDKATANNIYGYYVIPAGSSRTFTVYGQMDYRGSAASTKMLRIDAIRYGTVSSALAANTYSNNLSALQVVTVGGDGGGQNPSVPVVSGASATAGNAIVSNNLTIGRAMTFNFIVTAGNDTLYISRDPRVAFATSSTGFTDPNPSVLYGLNASPATLAGDRATMNNTYGYFVVPAGTSRSFTATGEMMWRGMPAGVKTFRINAVRYGLMSNGSLSLYNITAGVSNLQLAVTGGDDTPPVATTTANISVLGVSVVNTTRESANDTLEISFNTRIHNPNQSAITLSTNSPTNCGLCVYMYPLAFTVLRDGVAVFESGQPTPAGMPFIASDYSIPYAFPTTANGYTIPAGQTLTTPFRVSLTASNRISTIAGNYQVRLRGFYINGQLVPVTANNLSTSTRIPGTPPVATTTIRINSPVGGETWRIGENKTIRWTYPAELAGLPVAVSVNLNGANQSWQIFQADRLSVSAIPNSGGEVAWSNFNYENFPATGQYRVTVFIRDLRNNRNYMAYSNWFTVTREASTPTITVLSPNGGENYTIGSSVTIRWTTQNFGTRTVWLTLADKYGTSVPGGFLNAANIPNTGSYVWKIPANIVPSGTTGAFKIVASSYDNGPSASDLSNAPFNIAAPTTSASPTPSGATGACPSGYICTRTGSAPYCPTGYTCTTVTANCPTGYSCTTATYGVSETIVPATYIQYTTPSPTTSATPSNSSTPSTTPSPVNSQSTSPSASGATSLVPSRNFIANVFYAIGDILDLVF